MAITIFAFVAITIVVIFTLVSGQVYRDEDEDGQDKEE